MNQQCGKNSKLIYLYEVDNIDSESSYKALKLLIIFMNVSKSIKILSCSEYGITTRSQARGGLVL